MRFEEMKEKAEALLGKIEILLVQEGERVWCAKTRHTSVLERI
jgi:hypothetical protein